MKRLRFTPEVNAGSMADIAFLLLIFFLITAAIPKNKGINRKLSPKCPPNTICDKDIPKRNLLQIAINSNNEVMVNSTIVKIEDLKDLTKNFLDNNADGSCTYSNGVKLETSSDNPKEAVISLQSDRNTKYDTYIQVQDELAKAYYELRTNYIKTILKKSSDDITKEELKQVREAYPLILSEAETK